MPAYDAFISYSHALDKQLAAALQTAIQKLGKPWYARRSLRVFRDDTSLSATPQLWPSIEAALAQSRYLIVLASPQAAASEWVNKELAWWLANKSALTVLLALTEGDELRWGHVDFVQPDGSPPIPPALRGAFRTEPKWVDLRRYRAGASVHDRTFLETSADLAATIRGIPKEDLLSEEVRQQRRALSLAWAAAASLAVLGLIAGWQWREADAARRLAQKESVVASEQRDRAEHNLSLARATVEKLTSDVVMGLRDIEGVRIQAITRVLDTVRQNVEALTGQNPDDPKLADTRELMLQELAQTYVRSGQFNHAREAAMEALVLARAALIREPQSPQRLLRAASALVVVGWSRMEARELDSAKDLLSEALDKVRIVAKMQPDDVQAISQLSWILDMNGRLASLQGDRDTAAAYWLEEIATRRKLISLEPNNVDFNIMLSSALERLGTLTFNRGETQTGRKYIDESIETIIRTSSQEPGNMQLQRDLSVALIKRAALKLIDRDYINARVDYETALRIRRRLVSLDPGNVPRRTDLAAALGYIAEFLIAAGEYNGAKEYSVERLQILQQLEKDYPDVPRINTDLSSAKDQLARIEKATTR